MNEDLRSIIDSEYDKIEIEDQSTDYQSSINKQIEEQNTRLEKELNKNNAANDFLKKYNKEKVEDLTDDEVEDLLKEMINNVDKELKNLE